MATLVALRIHRKKASHSSANDSTTALETCIMYLKNTTGHRIAVAVDAEDADLLHAVVSKIGQHQDVTIIPVQPW